MLIKNTNLSEQEKAWLEIVLSCDFQGRAEIIQQINSAKIDREYTEGYLSIIFCVDKLLKPVKTNGRVPIEVRVFKEKEAPIQFLLHVIKGYVAELEIFHADSSSITSNLSVDNARVEYVVS